MIRKNNLKYEREGKINKNFQKDTMKIILYNNSNDIIVEFQDTYKTKVKSTYNQFICGQINNPNHYLGEININKQGCKMKIISFVNHKNITVEFQDEYKAIVRSQYNHFKEGSIRNPYHKSLCGVACIGETKTTYKNGSVKLSYKFWSDMINRCYSKKELDKRPTYKNVFVCKDWLCYKNFEEWFNENYYEIDGETMNLDKDILIKGNKEYSPQYSIFTPQKINNLFIKPSKTRKGLIGVEKINNKYRTIKVNSNHSTCFNTELKAFNEYKKLKENYIKQVAEEYKDKIPQKLYEAMYRYEVEITD